MSNSQKIAFLSRQYSIFFQFKYLKTSFQNTKAVHGLGPREFSTWKSFNFVTCPSSALNSNTQQRNQYCTFTIRALENNKALDVKHSSIKEFSEVDLFENDLMKTFRKLLRVYISKKSQRILTSDNEFQQFVNSNEFKNYCDSLEQRLPLLSAFELKLLLNCDLFGIPPSCILMQKIYHLIIEKINEYSVIELLDIYKKINNDRSKQNPKCKILLEVCYQCFEHRLITNCEEPVNYNEVAFFSQTEKIPLTTRRKLVKLLKENFSEAQAQMSVEGLCQMFKAFAQPYCNQYFRPHILKILRSRINIDLPPSTVTELLQSLKHLKNSIAYDEQFFEILVERSLAKSKDVITSATLSRKFLQMEHCCWPLISQLEATFSDPNCALESQLLSLRIAEVLSNVYYHPLGYQGDDSHHCGCIKKLEMFDFELLNVKDYVKWCMCITALGIGRKLEYLNRLFTHLSETYSGGNTTDELSGSTAEDIITLNAFARKFFPADVHELPQGLLEKCFVALKTDCCEYVNEILRNSDKISGQVYEYQTSSAHHFINFAVLVSNNSLSSEASEYSKDILKIEDIRRPPQSKLILYQMYKGGLPRQYSNSLTLPGRVQLYLQTFEQFDCKVVLLSEKRIKILGEKHKLSYVTSKIGEGLTS